METVDSSACEGAAGAVVDLIGAWRLIGNSRWEAGLMVNQNNMGPEPRGLIFYMPDRRVSVILARGDRRRMSAGRYDAPAEERSEAWTSFNAYAGRYTRTGSTVIHHVDLNSFENDVGADYIRHIEVNDGDLVLCTPAERVNGVERIFKLRWRRL